MRTVFDVRVIRWRRLSQRTQRRSIRKGAKSSKRRQCSTQKASIADEHLRLIRIPSRKHYRTRYLSGNPWPVTCLLQYIGEVVARPAGRRPRTLRDARPFTRIRGERAAVVHKQFGSMRDAQIKVFAQIDAPASHLPTLITRRDEHPGFRVIACTAATESFQSINGRHVGETRKNPPTAPRYWHRSTNDVSGDGPGSRHLEQ